MLEQFLQRLQQEQSSFSRVRTSKQILDGVEAIIKGQTEPTAAEKPLVEMIRDGSRQTIELLTKSYTVDQIEAMTKGTVALQLDSKLDRLVITPYVVSSDKKLTAFFKSKYVNHTPIVKATSQSILIVLHVGKPNMSLKENVMEAKHKLDALVSILSLGFAKGSYIAEPVTETQPPIIKDQQPLGVGSGIYEDVLEEAIQLPIGTVFMSEDRNDIFDADVLIIAPDNKFLTLNSSGGGTLIDLDEGDLMALGILVFIVDQISEEQVEEYMKNRKKARSYYSRVLMPKYDEIQSKLLRLRLNPRRKMSSPFSQWLYKMSPSFGSIKRRM